MGNWKLIRPEATTNLATNPSLETGITGWTAPGTNTVSQSSVESIFGNYSALYTYGNDSVLARFAFTFPSTSTSYRVSAWIKVDSTWDGGNISLGENAYGGATLTIIRQWVDGTDPVDEWFRIETDYAITSDAVGNIDFDLSSAPTAGKTVNIDGLQIEQKSGYSTTYCDGDQDKCSWNGTKHAATSTRVAGTRAGGRIVDLENDLGLFVSQISGAGFPPTVNVGQKRSLLDGVEHQRSVAGSGNLVLTGSIIGTSLSNYHSLRKLIVGDVRPDVINQEPILFWYQGAGVIRQFRARYAGGLQMRKGSGFNEQIGIHFEIDDAYATQVGQSSIALDFNDSVTTRTITLRNESGQWDVLGPPHASGFYNDIDDHVEDDTYIYFCGSFTNFDNITDANSVIRWHKENRVFSRMGGTGTVGGNGKGLTIASDGTVYLVGVFTNMGGDAVNHIAAWDGANWSQPGTPLSGATVTQMENCLVDLDGNFWVVGNFQNLAGIADADGVAFWDGSSWNAAGGPLAGNNASGIFLEKSSGDVYITGVFTDADAVAGTRGIARWDGTAWNSVGGGVTDGANSAGMLHFLEDGTFYVGGSFTEIGGVSVEEVAYFNGTNYEPFGATAPNNVVSHMAEWRNNILMGGIFTAIGDFTLADRFALWNGSSWAHNDIDLPGANVVTYLGTLRDGSIVLGSDTEGATEIAGLTTVSNEGTARAFPVITITRTGGTTSSLRTVGNETLGLMLWLDYDLQDGETLTIDLRPEKRSMTSSIYGKRWRMLPGSRAAEFVLAPGNNDITSLVVSTGSPTLTMFMTWEEQFFGAD